MSRQREESLDALMSLYDDFGSEIGESTDREEMAAFVNWLDEAGTDTPGGEPEEDSEDPEAPDTPTEESDEGEGDAPPDGDAPQPPPAPATTALAVSALLAMTVAVEVVLTGTFGATGVHPHPYWLIVLPVALSRGVVGALIASAGAATLYAFGAYEELAASSWWDVLDLHTMQEPILFLAVGFLIGEMRDQASGRQRLLWERLQRETERADRIRDERRLLSEANRELKRRLSQDNTQFGSMIEMAARIEGSDKGALVEVALDLVEQHCGRVEASVLAVLDDQHLDLIAQRGWPEGSTRRRLDEAMASPLVRRALDGGLRVNGLSQDVQETVYEGPIVIAPVADAAGVVRMIMCLDAIPVRLLNDTTVLTFFGIVDWITASQHRQEQGKKLIDYSEGFQQTAKFEPWLGSAEDLGGRIRIEDGRCGRQGEPTTLLALQVPVHSETTNQHFHRLDDIVLETFGQDFRPSDGLYRFGYPGCYAVVLSGTGEDDASFVRDRLSKRIEFTSSEQLRQTSVAVFAASAEHSDLASLVDPMAAHFREHSRVPVDSACPVHVPEDLVIGGIRDFARRVRAEWNLAIRNDDEVYVFLLSDQVRGAAATEAFAHQIEQVSRTTLRTTDGAYVAGPGRCGIVLPCTTCEGAFNTLERILDGLAESIPDDVAAGMTSEVLALGPDPHEYRALLDRIAAAEAGEDGP